jgi:hypothetical protein
MRLDKCKCVPEFQTTKFVEESSELQKVVRQCSFAVDRSAPRNEHSAEQTVAQKFTGQQALKRFRELTRQRTLETCSRPKSPDSGPHNAVES